MNAKRLRHGCRRRRLLTFYFSVPTVPDNSAGEQWRPVVGYEGIYEVSSLGRVKRIVPTERMKKPTKNSRGYLLVVLFKDSVGKMIYVHALVARAFIGSRPTPGHEVNHKNAIKTVNHADNLEYLTKKENMQHSVMMGCHEIGTRNHAAKLNPAKVRRIRKWLAKGRSMESIGKMFGVAGSTIREIKLGVCWKQVK